MMKTEHQLYCQEYYKLDKEKILAKRKSDRLDNLEKYAEKDAKGALTMEEFKVLCKKVVENAP